jgi:nitrite reductase/ring-hydroxylating ferredoxin subunit
MLAPLADLADGEAREFRFGRRGGAFSMFVIRQGGTVHAYVNICPHYGTPLNDRAPTFLTDDGTRIRCTTHFSEYRIDDGLGVAGYGEGCWLDPVPVAVVDGKIVVGGREPAD